MIKILVNGQLTDIADVTAIGEIVQIGSQVQVFYGTGWLNCDGSAVSRTTYASLFAVIGTTFGSGDGTSTFNLPASGAISVASAATMAQFVTDSVISCNNSAAITLDISAGAARAGIKLNIIETTTFGVTIYTDSGHTRSAILLQGLVVLEWDGTQWALLSETVWTSPEFVDTELSSILER